MRIHKWEIRYPLLLFMSANVLVAQAQDDPCKTNRESCKTNKGFVEQLNWVYQCISSQCVGYNLTVGQTRLISPKEEMTPVLEDWADTLPVQVNDTFLLVCRAWASSEKLLQAVDIETSSEPMLPEIFSREIVNYYEHDKYTKTAVFTTIKLILNTHRHMQNISCKMKVQQGSSASVEEKGRTATEYLYAFKQGKSKISGPTEAEIGATYIWVCTMPEVTFDKVTDFDLDLNTLPPTTQAKAETPSYVGTNSTYGPTRYTVSRKLKMMVPASFKPAFFVVCKATNKVLGPQHLVEQQEQLRVAVYVKPNDLSLIFNIVGGSFGLGGLALGVSLVVYYTRKKSAEQAAPIP